MVIAEGSETPGGESGAPAEGRGSGTEGDLLAERRARRAVESGETALVRRAEAAEATVRTLETHVASLQQRLRGAEEERRRLSGLIEAEKAAAGERTLSEQELRRAKQREYAEQQLRVEAEDRRTDVERESRSELERLTRRLSASEQHARELARQFEQAQRTLAEAEQATATEIAAAHRAEQAFQARLADLERRAVEIQHGLESERDARERSDRLLESMREGHRRVEALVGELGAMVARLRADAEPERRADAEPERFAPAGSPQTAAEPPQAHVRRPAVPSSDVPKPPDRPASPPQAPPRPEEVDRGEMAAALANAVERLRARVEDSGDGEQAGAHAQVGAGERAARPAVKAAVPAVKAAPHKHSMSLLTRLRIRRKERRRRRSAAAEPPSMKSQ